MEYIGIDVHKNQSQIAQFVVIKYMGDTFLDLSYEKQPDHLHKK